MRRLGTALLPLLLLTLCSCGSGTPGGDSGKEVLEKHNWLDEKGRVMYAEHSPERDVQKAICSYLFGTPSEVGDTAQLKGTVALDDDSGYRTVGGGGIGFDCVYTTGDEPVFAIELWSEKNDNDKAAHVVQVSLHDGLHGTTAYAPEYDGETIEADTARQWLKDAASRAQGKRG